jgi:hypothetical protein
LRVSELCGLRWDQIDFNSADIDGRHVISGRIITRKLDIENRSDHQSTGILEDRFERMLLPT